MDLADKLRGQIQTPAAARRLAQMLIDFARAGEPCLGRSPDVAVAVTIADTDEHAASVYE